MSEVFLFRLGTDKHRGLSTSIVLPADHLRIRVYLVIYDSGEVSLQHLLLSQHPSQSITADNRAGIRRHLRAATSPFSNQSPPNGKPQMQDPVASD